MNQLSDSRVEALAFNYVSFGIFTIVNNLWTWVAVITAAVSIWRIRAARPAISSCSVKSNEQSPSSSLIDRPTHEIEEKPTASPVVSVSSPASVTETCVSQSVCNDGATKGGMPKLTVYYYNDIGGKNAVEGDTTETEWCNGDGYRKEESCGGERRESWERVLRLRKGEKGWYLYQDLTAINGNVVRLWDDSCRRGRYSSSCSVW
ncbi:Plant invertase/pectin methylesterase inhibitor superfamily protein [Hibiscus syriacus]|uniref:Plant invertase/pectin methylesterase inhibitor superfamily protein n=1 Tax=Hibiscus syriacus TaxID=106335 RepID=A0A6A3BDP7_HIBSY|nr:uncharacterized protein LOC120218906 [Hibiscus syriacus]KAE8714071.1 Plant invertase/pectin methylesterase inhibitor superfamily protein [Hibiscus syriacus]